MISDNSSSDVEVIDIDITDHFFSHSCRTIIIIIIIIIIMVY